MKLETTPTPLEAAGKHISSKLGDKDTVILLSGGSALEVFAHITIPDKSECRTIFMMVDERVSGEASVNNYIQLQARYQDHQLFSQVIDTSAVENETPRNYATRIKNIFFEKVSELTEPQVITILGVGPDGHTAGIFPFEQERFSNTYEADSTYVPVEAASLTIDSRASFTPTWLLTNVDVLLGFIVGESKREILTKLINESKELHERPAEILKLHHNSYVYTDIAL